MNRIFAIVVTLISFACCLDAVAGLQGKLIIFHAGSLTVPFSKMEKDFEARHPQVDIERQAGGSVKMAKLISNEGKTADIMASADFDVIDKVLIPNYANWNIRFATNQLVLCYTSSSKLHGKINSNNWYDILTRKGISWGHSDPNLDPCGYRALMVMQLAEKYYKKPGLYKALLANRPQNNIRPKAAELVSLLKAGKLDFAWEYMSVAVQNDLCFLNLPEQINLGNYKFDQFYSQAKVKLNAGAPGKWITRTGKSCTYGITLIKNAPNPNAATAFLEYLLSSKGGLKILHDMGQPPFVPGRVPSDAMKSNLPDPLQKQVEVKN